MRSFSKLALGFIVALCLISGHPSRAFAQGDCRDLFDLRADLRLEALYGNLGRDPVTAAMRPLAAPQRHEFLQLTKRLLKTSHEHQTSHDFDQRYVEYAALIQDFEGESSFTYNEGMSLLTSVNNFVDFAAKFTEGEHDKGFLAVYQSPLTREKVLRRNAFNHHQVSGLVIPVDGALTIRDFNRLVGTGLFPVGLAGARIFADGQMMYPKHFADHDMAHTIWMAGTMSPEARRVWKSLLAWADDAPEPQTSARHAVLFQLSHESAVIQTALAGIFIRPELVYVSPLDGDLNTLVERVRAESYWDQEALKSAPHLEELLGKELSHVHEIYKQIVAHVRAG